MPKHLSLPPYPTEPGAYFQNPALRRYRAIKLIFPKFDQSNELTLSFLSERYVDARFWLNGKRYERVADFYDTWLVESLEYSDEPFPLTVWWDKRKLKARLAWEQQQKRRIEASSAA